MTASGERFALVSFQRATITKSGLGVEKPTGWTTIEEAWAKVLYGTGSERRTAAAEGAMSTATFRVPTSAALRTVTEQDRILVNDGPAWDITGIAPIKRRDIEFTAKLAKG